MIRPIANEVALKKSQGKKCYGSYSMMVSLRVTTKISPLDELMEVKYAFLAEDLVEDNDN